MREKQLKPHLQCGTDPRPIREYPRMIRPGPWSDRFRTVNGVSSVFRACAVDRIPLWFATVGSFPQCKWDCKWCWWMSCRWSFEGSLARNAFLRDSRCTKPYVFPYKVRPPNLDDLPLRCDGVRDGLVCGRIILGSWSDHSRTMVGSVPHCKWGFKCFFVHARSTEFHCDLQL